MESCLNSSIEFEINFLSAVGFFFFSKNTVRIVLPLDEFDNANINFNEMNTL